MQMEDSALAVGPGRALACLRLRGLSGLTPSRTPRVRMARSICGLTCSSVQPKLLGMRIRHAALLTIATLSASALARPQEPVNPAADVESLFQDHNPKLNEMKQVAYHIERDLLQCNHWDEAEKWLTERYVQHNPLVASGRAAVVKFFGSRPKPASCSKLTAPVVAVLADGDLVAVVTVVTVANRKDSKGEPYTTTWFDMWRIKDGKADEHWDPMTKP
jgi:predicted SnoaL-like aldol condensation-catalyzing enzyme